MEGDRFEVEKYFKKCIFGTVFQIWYGQAIFINRAAQMVPQK